MLAKNHVPHRARALSAPVSWKCGPNVPIHGIFFCTPSTRTSSLHS